MHKKFMKKLGDKYKTILHNESIVFKKYDSSMLSATFEKIVALAPSLMEGGKTVLCSPKEAIFAFIKL